MNIRRKVSLLFDRKYRRALNSLDPVVVKSEYDNLEEKLTVSKQRVMEQYGQVALTSHNLDFYQNLGEIIIDVTGYEDFDTSERISDGAQLLDISRRRLERLKSRSDTVRLKRDNVGEHLSNLGGLAML